MQDSVKDLLHRIEELSKSMSNSGLGGAGSVKNGGVVLPNKTTKPKSNNSLSSKIKIPSVAQASNKNPIKSAQQIHNKDVKDIKMKEALSQVSEMVKSLPNGQWVIEKTNENDGTTQTEADKLELNKSISDHINYIREKLSKKSRCWEGYEPVPGKKAYDKGSCRPMSKKECECEDEHKDEHKDCSCD
jgi:hypothetical protein